MRLIFVPILLALAAVPASARDYTCHPAIRVVVDLGFCFGFVKSYYEAAGNVDILGKMAEGKVEDRIRQAHDQCFPTSFDQQQVLGELAFSSYLNLKDLTLLKQSASDCSTLMKLYADQASSAETALNKN